MKPQTKVFKTIELKLDGDGAGTFEAVFATLDAIDHDGDSYDPGAIGNQDVVISQWNHGSWDGGVKALPVGVGQIFERGNQAIVAGEFDMEDPDGEKTYRKLKYLDSKGRNVEWSFALPDSDWRMEERDGRDVRVYTRIAIPEVSPVLLGAGIGTELLSIKSREGETMDDAIMRADDLTGNTIGRQFADAARAKFDKEMGLIPNESMTFVKQLDEAVEAVEKVAGRAKQIQNLREEKGKDDMSRASTRRLKALRDSLVEVTADVDDLLTDPNDELSELAESFDGGTE